MGKNKRFQHQHSKSFNRTTLKREPKKRWTYT